MGIYFRRVVGVMWAGMAIASGIAAQPRLRYIRNHAPWAAARLFRTCRVLEQVRIVLVLLDEVSEVFDAVVGECHDGVVTWSVNPDQTVLRVHSVGDVRQPVLVFAEHFDDTRDCLDTVDLIDRGHGQAATAETVDAAGVQFHGNSSLSR